MRVALAQLTWPLDPAFADDRDELAVARALFATPLRTDSRSGALRAGLCRSWKRSRTAREWRFQCAHARAIAAALRRGSRLAYGPNRWVFSQIRHISIRGKDTLVVALRRPWLRFPYLLTVPAAAPRGIRGPFRVVSASPQKIVVRRPGLTLVFERLEAHAAASAFRHGRVDEAPVPLGDLRAARADPQLEHAVRVRRLLGVDLVGFRTDGGPLARRPELRRVYWTTADRFDYQALVPEFAAPRALSLIASEAGSTHARAAAVRRAARRIGSLPSVHVPVAVPRGSPLVYGADVVVAQWRELGLGPTVDPTPAFERRLAEGRLGAWFERVVAPYPESEALLAAAVRTDTKSPRRLLERALGLRNQTALLADADAELENTAAIVPVAWVTDARLVSPRLRGWYEDEVGAVDYTRIRTR